MWGRATGKTHYFGFSTMNMIKEMPRSNGLLVGRTYGQLQMIVVPEVIHAWERLGYRNGIHYVVGRRPPKNLKFDSPFRDHSQCEYTIWWFNGAVIDLVSQDREGAARGYNVDYVIADEGLTLLPDRFRKEVLATNRGNKEKGWTSNRHHSVIISSSKPMGTDGAWLLEMGQYYEKEGYDFDLYNKQIADLQIQLILAFQENQSVAEKANIAQKIVSLKRKVKYYKHDVGKDTELFYNEANAFDNLAFVGFDYIMRQYRDMTELEFRVEMLNQTLKEIEDGFYFSLSEQKHCYYDTYNYSYLDDIGWDQERLQVKDCRADGDLDPNAPLDIAGDYGYYLNCLVVGQEMRTAKGWYYKFLNSFWEKPPKTVEDVAEGFCQYYRFHSNKRINYFYDHTSIDKAKGFSYREQVVKVFQKHGWSVSEVYLGQQPGHDSRYHLWARALQGDDRLPLPIFSMPRCKYLVLAMQLAGVAQGKNGFEKDKRPEKNHDIPQEETTHQTDAADTLFYGKFIGELKDKGEFVDNLMM